MVSNMNRILVAVLVYLLCIVNSMGADPYEITTGNCGLQSTRSDTLGFQKTIVFCNNGPSRFLLQIYDYDVTESNYSLHLTPLDQDLPDRFIAMFREREIGSHPLSGSFFSFPSVFESGVSMSVLDHQYVVALLDFLENSKGHEIVFYLDGKYENYQVIGLPDSLSSVLGAFRYALHLSTN